MDGEDGTIFVRATATGVTYGQTANSVGQKRTLAAARSNPYGTIYIPIEDSVDGAAKHVSFRNLEQYNLLINVGMAEDDILSEYHDQTSAIAIAAAIFTLILLILAVLGERRSRLIRSQAQSLREHAHQLEQQTGDLEAARRNAEQADKLKGDFIANMSHEFRTPLNAIIGFSTFLAEINPKGGADPSVLYLDGIRQAGSHLLAMVNDILDLAQVENGHLVLNRECYDLAELLEECADNTRSQRQDKAITLALDGEKSCPVWCDPLRVRQAVLNILSNAIKFSPDRATVTLRLTRPDSGHAAITITDTGSGMSEEDVTIALTPFAQVSSGFTKAFGGAGLGLPLAKRLIECQGGAFFIMSQRGEGTTVVMTLPLDSPAPAEAPTETTAVPSPPLEPCGEHI